MTQALIESLSSEKKIIGTRIKEKISFKYSDIDSYLVKNIGKTI
jgi:hypothetical protein